MEEFSPLSLNVPLPVPSRGRSTRARIGGAELVLEGVRGGHSLLWTDGRETRRYALGLGRGSLMLELRAPRFMVRVVARDTLTVAPWARLQGYVQVPLVPTLVFRGHDGESAVLLELLPRSLAGEWDETLGYAFRCASPWLVRFPVRSGDAVAVVPVRLRNDDAAPASPAHLSLRLTDADLVERRGTIVVRPRRLVFRGEEFLESTFRTLAEHRA